LGAASPNTIAPKEIRLQADDELIKCPRGQRKKHEIALVLMPRRVAMLPLDKAWMMAGKALAMMPALAFTTGIP